MKEVTLFVQTGKNKHDDACDSLAMLVEFLDTRGLMVTVMRRPSKAKKQRKKKEIVD